MQAETRLKPEDTGANSDEAKAGSGLTKVVTEVISGENQKRPKIAWGEVHVFACQNVECRAGVSGITPDNRLIAVSPQLWPSRVE